MNHTDLENQAERAARDERFGARRARRPGESRRRFEMERLREVGKNLGGQIDEQVRKRPYVAVGAALGAGFVAGSFLGSRLGQMLLAVGVGFVARSVIEGDLTAEGIRNGIEKITGSSD
jgi:ElaB/YqjD/DUF883 family membrane-anchored ribosome-binding protein